MPAMPVYITVTSSSSAPSRPVNLDYNKSAPFNTSVTADFGSTSMTATFFAETTRQDQQYLSAIGSTIAITWQQDATFGASSSPGTVTYTSPMAAIRFSVTAISSSFVRFSVLQS